MAALTRFDAIAAHLSSANDLARQEILFVLREPQRKIATLIHNRAVQLQEVEAELAVLEEDLSDERWGSF